MRSARRSAFGEGGRLTIEAAPQRRDLLGDGAPVSNPTNSESQSSRATILGLMRLPRTTPSRFCQ
jgi:hypothetical protein